MNSSNFILTGGYPLKAERLQELQTAFSIFNALGALAGNLTIISGCALTGSIIGDGFVYINGELLDFKEATVTPSSSVIIIEEAVNRGFKNGTVKQVHTIRYATFGTAETSWLWTAFKKVDPLIVIMAKITELEKKNAVFQSGGGMVFWNKPANQIPAGWQEVVEWRGRFPVGYDVSQTEFNTMGKQSGQKNKTLSINEIPAHSHSGHLVKATSTWRGSGSDSGDNATSTSGNSGSQGGGQAFSILNPYRTVLFIEYTL